MTRSGWDQRVVQLLKLIINHNQWNSWINVEIMDGIMVPHI